jgi:iron complex outermembrane recepter protein
LTWTPDATNTIVWSVTRAVRTPSRVETDYTTTNLVNSAVPLFVRLQPNPDFTSEKLTAYEMGYRVRPASSLYLTASAFFNKLDDMLSTELRTPFVETVPPPQRMIIPVTFANELHGGSYGIEITGDLRLTNWWRWTGNYSYLRIEMTRDEGGADVSQEQRYEGLSPRHQVQVHASVDLSKGWTADWMLRHVSELRLGPVPAYTTSDLRVGWEISPQLELAIVGRNLHHDRHAEWESVGIRRSAHVRLTWRR